MLRTWRTHITWVLVSSRPGPQRGSCGCYTDSEAEILEREIIVFRRVGETYRQSTELHRVRLFDPAELARWLAEAGLEPEEIGGYGEQRLSPGRIGFAARKPPAA